MKDSYRFRIMALIVETAAISSPTSVNVTDPAIVIKTNIKNVMS
jgi:hypothetical protein